MTDRNGKGSGGGEYVGYRNPPTSSQFVKGRSGNPRGRPRRPKTAAAGVFGDSEFDEMIVEEMDRLVSVREGETVAKHPTQIYEALSYLLIFVLLLKLYFQSKGKPKEGLLFGIFLILTFTMRFLIEFLKNNQVEFEKSMFLNMGQLLSIPLVIAGVAILFYISIKCSINNKILIIKLQR